MSDQLNIEGSEDDGHDECGQASGSASEVLVPKKGPHSSSMWNFFGFAPDDDLQKQAICMQCHGIVKTKSGNTINLLNHFERHHKIQYEQATKDNPKKKKPGRPTTQTSITQTLYNATPYPDSSRRHKEITEAVTFFLAKDMASMNTVQNDGFKHLVKTLDK